MNGTKSVSLRLFSKFMLFKIKRFNETAKISSKKNAPWAFLALRGGEMKEKAVKETK